MATPSLKTYTVAGFELSLGILQDAADVLPPPVPTIVNVAQRVVAISQTVDASREICERLRKQIQEILPVVVTNTQRVFAIYNETSLPKAFQDNLDLFKSKLETTLETLDRIAQGTSSKRKRDIAKKWFLANRIAGDLQQCQQDLDWAMKTFDVTASLSSCVQLYEISKQVGDVHANSFLEALPRSKMAGFECERPDQPSSCLQGTREAILNEIEEWSGVHNPSSTPFFWLRGPAGTGKTAIALSVAEKARSSGYLGASFIFSRRGEADLRDASRVFPTITYQLASFDRAIGSAIVRALSKDRQAPYRKLQEQLDELLIKPLNEVYRAPNRTIMIVFDAFDECEPTGAETILRLLINSISRLPLFLKIFITSRDEHHIRKTLAQVDGVQSSALQDIGEEIVSGDVRLYLDRELRQLGQDQVPPLPGSWISDREIDDLTSATGSLFIYAATAVRFLRSSLNCLEQLHRLLELIHSSHPAQTGGRFHNLDRLYEEVLLGTISHENEIEVVALMQAVLGSLVLLRDPLPVDALDRLVGLKSGESLRILERLRSVILPPVPPDNSPRIYHKSFSDHLQDQRRCTDHRLWINPEVHEARMALRCLELMNEKLQLNMLGEHNTRLLRREVINLGSKIANTFSPELRYVCLFWPSHLMKVPRENMDKMLLSALTIFATTKLVAWVESMGWLGQTGAAIRSLQRLNEWMGDVPQPSIVVTLLRCAYHLLTTYQDVIEAAPLHIPHSVLPFIPQDTPLAQFYSGSAGIKVVHGVRNHWSPELATLRSHTEVILSVAFSTDGTHLASGSADNTVKLWDAKTGDILRTLEGHTEPVGSVAFSPDGLHIVSGSDDRTVKVWESNVTTGGILRSLEGHTEPVRSVAFSPDGLRIVSGSDDQTVKVWYVTTGDILCSLEGHADYVRSVAFSPDGLNLVSGSNDRTVKVWNVMAGNVLHSLEGHSDSVRSVAFSPDGSHVMSCSIYSLVKVWDVNTGKLVDPIDQDSLDSHDDKNPSQLDLSIPIAPGAVELELVRSGPTDMSVKHTRLHSYVCLVSGNFRGYWIGLGAAAIFRVPQSTVHRIAIGNPAGRMLILEVDSA